MNSGSNDNNASQVRTRRSTFMVPYLLFCAVLMGLSWNWIYQWRSQEPDWGADSDLAGQLWAEVSESNYRTAAKFCEILLVQDPTNALDGCELISSTYGEQPIDAVKRWQKVKGPPGSPEDRFRIRAKQVENMLTAAMDYRQRDDPKHEKIVTGLCAGYLTWRPTPTRGIVVMPADCGLILEVRHLPPNAIRWPSRSIYCWRSEIAWDAIDLGGYFERREPLVSVAKLQIGSSKTVQRGTMFGSKYIWEAQHILIPYWLMIALLGIVPCRALQRWRRRAKWRRRGFCAKSGYDLRDPSAVSRMWRVASQRCPLMRSSIKLLAGLYLVVSLILGAMSAARGAESPLSLKAELPERAYKAGEPVDLNLTLKNVSQADVVLLVSNTEWEFPILISDSHGKGMPPTRYGDRLYKDRGTAHQSFQRMTLKPGETLTGQLRVNLQYDMTLKGDYRISVAYQAIAPKEEQFPEATAPDVAVRIE